MTRRAKIGATLGPASTEPKTMERLLEAGLDIARLNFSHGTADEHRATVKRWRAAAKRTGRRPALLADLQGPRFRVGLLEGGRLDLVQGTRVELVAGKQRAAAGAIPVSPAALARDVRKGQSILLDDGSLELTVLDVRGTRVRCEVVRGGVLTDHKGINLPESDISVPALTAKDRRDLQLAVELGADWLAVSFVRRAADLQLARRLLQKAGSAMPVMAKIERQEAIERLDEILVAADGILVARGDLGVELAPERVPILQKQIIEAANRAGRPVMTATQMLDSMRHTARPTRAEASDVANAVLDGSSSLLLTAETAVGAYPVETVRMMSRIIEQAEAADRGPRDRGPSGDLDIPLTTALAGCLAASQVRAKYLVVFTQSGFSAAQAARFRPPTPILAFTPDEAVCRRLQMHWGVEPQLLPRKKTIEQLIVAVDRGLLEHPTIHPGDVIVMLFGAPLGQPGTTNAVLLHRVGDPLR